MITLNLVGGGPLDGPLRVDHPEGAPVPDITLTNNDTGETWTYLPTDDPQVFRFQKVVHDA
jgi:hypothetical protein